MVHGAHVRTPLRSRFLRVLRGGTFVVFFASLRRSASWDIARRVMRTHCSAAYARGHTLKS